MGNSTKTQMLSYVGCIALLLALLLPVVRIAIPMESVKMGLGLISNMSILGEGSWLVYLIGPLSLVFLVYAIYATFKLEKDYTRIAYICGGLFVILLIIYFVARGEVKDMMGGFRDENPLKMGAGLFMFLIAGACYFFAGKPEILDTVKK